MTNSYRDYKQNFINNLPSGVTYDSDLGRFFFNGKKFYTAQSVVWYRDYILKYDPDAAPSPFTPASLFASGEEGIWLEPSPSTCFTDTGGTTAASVGDPVARINDSSGNGNHATQGTLASRPILRQTGGGLYYLEFDGTDDALATPSVDLSGTAVFSAFVGVGKDTDGDEIIFESGNPYFNVPGGFLFSKSSSGAFSRSLNTSSSSGSGFSNTTSSARPGSDLSVHAFEKNLSLSPESAISVYSRVNGSEDVASSLFSTPTTAANMGNRVMYIGARGGSSLFFEGDLYSLIVRGAATSGDDLTGAESYVADKTGVTL